MHRCHSSDVIEGMRPFGSAKQLERRRRQAIRLLKAEKIKNLSAIARSVGVTHSTVSRWIKAYTSRGLNALKAKPVPGRPSTLTEAQKRRLVKLIDKGPRAAGYFNELWTIKRITQLIKDYFRVSFHPGHVWRVVRSLGFSPQVPQRFAIQRIEPDIDHWKRYTWPRIKKKRIPSARP
jgi:transposase